MDIINDRFFAKIKIKIEWGPDQVLRLAKLKKYFATNTLLTMYDSKK